MTRDFMLSVIDTDSHLFIVEEEQKRESRRRSVQNALHITIRHFCLRLSYNTVFLSKLSAVMTIPNSRSSELRPTLLR